MKLNGLTNNLGGNDKSLSNSYLSHIVELLRKELEALTVQFNELDKEATEHIETQKTLVKTVKVEAESINDKISFLTNAIEMFGSAKLNGHNILTDETFQGPFTYKGEVEALPEDANAGDVYIYDGKVSIYNGTSYDSFIIPVGMVSKAEYDADQIIIKQDITDNTNDIAVVKEDVTQLAANVGSEIGKINEALTNTVNKNPVDEKVYVRKNDEWVELSTAANTVKATSGESSISNEETGVTITAPKVEINSKDIKVNGTALTEASKFALTKTNKSDDTVTYYELQYKQKPIGPFSSTVYGYTTLTNDSRYSIKGTNNQKWTVTTRDYQYCKQCDAPGWVNDVSTFITSMDREGNIKQLYFPAQQLQIAQTSNLIADWMVWNPEFCPEGFENKAYLFFPWCYGTYNRAALLEYDNGDFLRSYDMTKQITDQGGKLQTAELSSGTSVTGAGGKALRNKNIQRICWIAKDTTDGGTYAIVFGGDKNSKVTDPFDTSKCIYIKLPATACPGYTAMAATDKAWYVSEYDTGRIMRITPDGQVTEYNLSSTGYKAGIGNYIEYTDKNNRPACAFRLWDSTTGAKKEAICFFEEREDGNVNFEEVSMAPYTYAGWDSNNWRMMENDYYIFFTAGCGFGYETTSENSFPSAATVKKLFYWDKATHTTHVIDDLYGLNATWDNGNMSMYKTREKAIWIVPHVKALATANRTGEFKYILNRDYTNIDETTGKDTGSIEVQTATIGANHPWFTCNGDTGYNKFVIMLQDSTDIGKSALYYQYACVNDDGIGFLMSPDYKAFALFYGEGNIKVYECSDIDNKAATYDPNVQQLLPDEMFDAIEYESASCEGLKHGWLIRSTAYKTANGFENMDRSSGCRAYIGLHYKNGEPTILERPTITILRKHTADVANAKHRYNYYSYLLTYDDYERRKLIMRGIFKNITYGCAARGIDSYYEEVEHNAKKKLNLEYDGQVVSSVDD